MEARLVTRGRMVFLLCLVLVIVVLVNIFNYFKSAKITVSTNTSSVVEVSTEKDGEFKKVGDGDTTFRTLETGDIYIRTTNNDGMSVRGLSVENFKSYQIELNVSDTYDRSFAYFGAVSYGIKDGTLVQGIQPDTSDVTSFDTESFKPPKIGFISVPYLKRIIWDDNDSFIYVSFTGIGLFKNGSNLGVNEFAIKVYTKEGIEPAGFGIENDELNAITLSLKDIVRHSKSSPLFLLSSEGLYSSSDTGKTVQKILHINDTENSKIIAANNKVIVTTGITPSEYAGEHDHDHDEKEAKYIDVAILSGDGDELESFEIEGSAVNYSASSDTESILVTDEALGLIDESNNLITQPIYTNLTRSAISFNEQLFVLNDYGVFVFKDDALRMVHRFNSSETGVENSFYTSTGELVFGVRDDESKDSSLISYYLDVLKN